MARAGVEIAVQCPRAFANSPGLNAATPTLHRPGFRDERPTLAQHPTHGSRRRNAPGATLRQIRRLRTGFQTTRTLFSPIQTPPWDFTAQFYCMLRCSEAYDEPQQYLQGVTECPRQISNVRI